MHSQDFILLMEVLPGDWESMPFHVNMSLYYVMKIKPIAIGQLTDYVRGEYIFTWSLWVIQHM